MVGSIEQQYIRSRPVTTSRQLMAYDERGDRVTTTEIRRSEERRTGRRRQTGTGQEGRKTSVPFVPGTGGSAADVQRGHGPAANAHTPIDGNGPAGRLLHRRRYCFTSNPKDGCTTFVHSNTADRPSVGTDTPNNRAKAVAAHRRHWHSPPTQYPWLGTTASKPFKSMDVQRAPRPWRRRRRLDRRAGSRRASTATRTTALPHPSQPPPTTTVRRSNRR